MSLPLFPGDLHEKGDLLPVTLPDLTVGASVPFAEMIASGMAT